LFSLTQAGVNLGSRKIIVAMGLGALPLEPVPSLAGLEGATIALTDFLGGPAEGLAWQAGLVQAGASRAVVLTRGSHDQETDVVDQALAGTVIPFVAAVILYDVGQASPPPNADSALARLLYLVQSAYPQSRAIAYGAADSLPNSGQGGNEGLALERSKQIVAWLESHGVNSSRLQAVGYGDANPIVPETDRGQLMNRRTIVVIYPGGS
jgi:outer membrane protein OmpA-like peptidoglycan-associated protein